MVIGGDNFCCAVNTDATVSCVGGNSFTTVTASDSGVSDYDDLSSVKYVACGGKSLAAIGASDQILAVMGKTGYGADSFDSSYLGTVVTDVSVSFWGGAFIDSSDGSITAWSQSSTYASSSSSQSWYPASDTSGSSCECTTSTRDMSLTAPSSSSHFAMVACGGKRAGHFCCAVLSSSDSTGGDTTQCFGDDNGVYTPTQSELSSQGLLDYTPYSISAGCDFLCVLTDGGILGVYKHSSDQFDDYVSSLSLDDDTGLDTSGSLYVQAACGTFAAYGVDALGELTTHGRVFSSDVGPVDAGTDTGGEASSFTNYLQRDTDATFAIVAANSGFGHACGVSTSGGGECWGADYGDQATDGSALSGIDTSNIYPSLLNITAADDGAASGGDDDDDDAPSDMTLVWVVCGVGAVVLIGAGAYLTKSGGGAGGASKTGSEQTSAKGGLELA